MLLVKYGYMRLIEPKYSTAQGFSKFYCFMISTTSGKEGGHHEEDILPSISFSPFPVLTLPFALEINIVIYQKGFTQASSPFSDISVQSFLLKSGNPYVWLRR